MTNIVIFQNKARVAVSTLKERELKNKLTSLLTECSQLIGFEMAKDNLIFAAEQLAEILKRNYTKYDFSEIAQILKNGFAYFGTEYKNISVASCLSIIRKFDEDPFNKTQLQKAIQTSEEYKGGEMLEQERIVANKKHRKLSFDRAKEKYESEQVKIHEIHFNFSACYQYVKDDLGDNSIDISTEKQKEIWDKTKEIYEHYDVKNLPEDKRGLIDIFLKTVPQEIMLKTMFCSILFHLWAVKNFETANPENLSF